MVKQRESCDFPETAYKIQAPRKESDGMLGPQCPVGQMLVAGAMSTWTCRLRDCMGEERNAAEQSKPTEGR